MKIKRKSIFIFLIFSVCFLSEMFISKGYAETDNFLVTGENFNKTLKKSIDVNYETYETEDTILKYLTFDKYSDEKYGESGSVFSLNWEDGINVDLSNLGHIKLFYDSDSLSAYVLTDLDDKIKFNTNSRAMFQNFESLEKINFNNIIDTSDVTIMSNMFYNCKSLKKLDLKDYNTTNVTNMSFMFYYCSNLEEVDVSNFNTINLTLMHDMFSECISLSRIDLSSFNTSKVINMSHLFYDCLTLKELDLSNFDTSNVTNMANMFSHCKNLININLSNFDTRKVTTMNNMFRECYNLKILDLSSFNASENISYMFYKCINLETIFVSEYDEASNKGWDVTKVTNSSRMFEDDSKLVGGYGSSLTQYAVTDKTYAVLDNQSQQGFMTLKRNYTGLIDIEYYINNNQNISINFTPAIHNITNISIVNENINFTLEAMKHYFIEDGKVILDYNYLNTLEIGEYKIYIQNKDSLEENVINLTIKNDNVVNTADRLGIYISLFILSFSNFVILSLIIFFKKNKKEELEVI